MPAQFVQLGPLQWFNVEAIQYVRVCSPSEYGDVPLAFVLLSHNPHEVAVRGEESISRLLALLRAYNPDRRPSFAEDREARAILDRASTSACTLTAPRTRVMILRVAPERSTHDRTLSELPHELDHP